MVEHHGLAVGEIGRQRPERNRQLVEPLEGRHRQEGFAQLGGELLALDQALRHLQLAAAIAYRQVDEKLAIVLLAPEVEVCPAGPIAECIDPVNRAEQVLDLVGRHAGGIQAADHRAHAGPCNRIDRYPQALELLQHADVRAAASPAAGQHETNTGPLRRRGHRTCRLGRQARRPDERRCQRHGQPAVPGWQAPVPHGGPSSARSRTHTASRIAQRR